VEFPLDVDGFLRRECPSCREQFKWHHGPTETRPADAVDPARYSCPSCGRQVNHDEWLTADQLQYQQETVSFYAMDVVNAEMKKAFGWLRRLAHRLLPPHRPPRIGLGPKPMSSMGEWCKAGL